MTVDNLMQLGEVTVGASFSIVFVLFFIGIALLVQLALAASVAEEAAAKGYRYSDYFWSSFFASYWASRAIVRSLPHKSRLRDDPISGHTSGTRKRFGRKSAPACYNCSSPLLEGADFCGECGSKLTTTKPVVAANTVRDAIACRTCGTVCAGTANFCSSCGKALRDIPTAMPVDSTGPASSPHLSRFDSSYRDDQSSHHPGKR